MDFTKPRLAIYYDVLAATGFRNDGCPLFMNYNARKILNGDPKMDDSRNVVHLSPINDMKKHGNFDLNLLVDYAEDVLDIPIDWEIPHPSAYWVSDAHLGYDYRLKRAKQMDWVFCAQKRAMEEFIRDGIPREKCFWLPHAVEPDCYKPYSIVERWDWSFIGHLNSEHRIDLMDRFCKEFPNFYLGWRQREYRGYNVLDDAAKKFCQSRLIVSDSVQDDINMRTFEALACKRLLLTNRIPNLDELFVDGEHLVLYDSIDDAVAKAKSFLSPAREAERLHIAEMGYQETIAKHTYKHRMLTILEKTIGYVPETQEAVKC